MYNMVTKHCSVISVFKSERNHASDAIHMKKQQDYNMKTEETARPDLKLS